MLAEILKNTNNITWIKFNNYRNNWDGKSFRVTCSDKFNETERAVWHVHTPDGPSSFYAETLISLEEQKKITLSRKPRCPDCPRAPKEKL